MSAFDQIIGYENIKEELKWYSDILKNPKNYEKLGVSGPSGLLLYGDPGVGKSMMAKALISESGCKAYTLRKNLPNGDFVKEIKRVFDEAAENAPSIVLLDDVDKFANCDYSHTDAEEYVTIQACMDECKGKNVFVVATANDRFYLPDSLLRPGRFDKRIEVGLPNREEAEQIIDYYLKNKAIDKDVDSKEVSRLIAGNSCAVLENVINEAGIMAAYKKKKLIRREDIINACIRYICEAPLVSEIKNFENAELIALHEAGHVVAAEILQPGSVGVAYLGNSDGNIRGFAVIQKKEGYSYCLDGEEFDILHALGGKAAVEVIRGKRDVGCTSDMKAVFLKVRNLVERECAFGMEGYIFRNMPSDISLSRTEEIVLREVKRYYDQTRSIIAENRLFVGAVTAALLEKRIVTGKEIEVIRRSLTDRK